MEHIRKANEWKAFSKHAIISTGRENKLVKEQQILKKLSQPNECSSQSFDSSDFDTCENHRTICFERELEMTLTTAAIHVQ